LNPNAKLSKLLESKLEARAQTGALRSLTLDSTGIDFYSNDYLGLAKSKALHSYTNELWANYHNVRQLNGSTGSRLLAGNSALAEETESKLADHFQAESALIYGSGYAANTGLLSCLPSRHDIILMDELSHASLKEGARLSLAKKIYFRHNDMAHLKELLQSQNAEQCYVVSESVFSMDGDLAPLSDLVQLCEQFGAILIIDEAHSTGVIGQAGAGLSVMLDLQHRIPIRIHTFGKGPGVHGAAILGTAKLREYLINFSHPFIYSTAPSAHFYLAIQASLHLMCTETQRQQDLQTTISQYLALAATLDKNLSANHSPIQYIELGTNEATKAKASQLVKAGISAKAVLPPTVPEGKARIRLCLHSYNTAEELELLFGLL